jgi:hypothetical protein
MSTFWFIHISSTTTGIIFLSAVFPLPLVGDCELGGQSELSSASQFHVFDSREDITSDCIYVQDAPVRLFA